MRLRLRILESACPRLNFETSDGMKRTQPEFQERQEGSVMANALVVIDGR
jgi:hypothetical protein